MAGAERFRRDPELKQALLTLARHEHTRECLLLLEAILETPGLTPRLAEVLLKHESKHEAGTQELEDTEKRNTDRTNKQSARTAKPKPKARSRAVRKA